MTVVWITGLPASGKSTLAGAVRARLTRPSALLDGDEVRGALVPAPGYDPSGRDAFYETLARLAALLAGQGLVVIVAATSHRRAYRDAARARVDRFVEVWVRTPVEVCVARDPKRLYATAQPQLPGRDVAYEVPERPEIVAEGGEDADAVERILDTVGQPSM